MVEGGSVLARHCPPPPPPPSRASPPPHPHRAVTIRRLGGRGIGMGVWTKRGRAIVRLSGRLGAVGGLFFTVSFQLLAAACLPVRNITLAGRSMGGGGCEWGDRRTGWWLALGRSAAGI